MSNLSADCCSALFFVWAAAFDEGRAQPTVAVPALPEPVFAGALGAAGSIYVLAPAA